MSTKNTLLISIVVLLAAGGITTAIFMTEPTAERSGAVRENAMLVETIVVERGTFYPTIQTMGSVEPTIDINLSPQVGGYVQRVSEAFTPGGVVRKGEVLLEMDPADYRNTLAQRQSALSQAVADLNIESGRQQIARQDFALLGDTLALENQALVLREPQLDAARARVAAAEAAVQQARLDLERTTIRAPFDAHILSRLANVGSQVAAGENLGRLVGVNAYWVVATIPQSQLRWLTFPASGSAPSVVRVRNRTAWPENMYRTGTLHRLVGALEDQTRLARILVDVPDPMSYLPANADAPPLMIGSFVEADIEAKPLQDVMRLSRDYIRDDDTVWEMKDGMLRIREVDIIFQDAVYAYIASGLASGAQVVTTNLSTVVEGAPLRTLDTQGIDGSGVDRREVLPAPSDDEAGSDNA